MDNEPSTERRTFLKLVLAFLIGLAIPFGVSEAAVQDNFGLSEPYAGLEKAYLKEYPKLQEVMDVMVGTYAGQLNDPAQDILHVRVVSALAYRMANELTLQTKERMLFVTAALLHDISKQDKKVLLTDPIVFAQSAELVTTLWKAGFLKDSKRFWTDEKLLKMPSVGGNLALIHHITGAFQAGQILKKAGFAEPDIKTVQMAIICHSTCYWYFRDAVDNFAQSEDAWQAIYPEPIGNIALFVTDADLVSQFVPESVVPNGSKWREIAKQRWGAKNTQEEAHIVYYVFFRLYKEARTKQGKELAREKWDVIRPALVKLMGLDIADDPIKKLGVPAAFKK
ncbi:MAG TPA: hypothetical protein VLX29_09015 [Nitrospirota bacterium]|nr:hypothetical protein [Nitrospirota bacterium]